MFVLALRIVSKIINQWFPKYHNSCRILDSCWAFFNVSSNLTDSKNAHFGWVAMEIYIHTYIHVIHPLLCWRHLSKSLCRNRIVRQVLGYGMQDGWDALQKPSKKNWLWYTWFILLMMTESCGDKVYKNICSSFKTKVNILKVKHSWTRRIRKSHLKNALA